MVYDASNLSSDRLVQVIVLIAFVFSFFFLLLRAILVAFVIPVMDGLMRSIQGEVSWSIFSQIML